VYAVRDEALRHGDLALCRTERGKADYRVPGAIKGALADDPVVESHWSTLPGCWRLIAWLALSAGR